jgi:tetratricopeptide (TPR) repeat protein
LDETADLGNRANIATEIARFAGLAEDQKLDEIADRLKVICDSSFVPCFMDEGGLLAEDGRYHEVYVALMNVLMSRDDVHLAFIHRRHPHVDELLDRFAITELGVRPIETPAMRLLVHQLLRPLNLKATAADVNELVEYLDGYPPAAYMLAGFAARYGFAALLADKSILQDFKARVFARFIGALWLTDSEWSILQYLAAEQAVPLVALGVATELGSGELVPMLRKLIDLSLVIVVDDAFAVSGPVRTAIQRARGLIGEREYARIVAALTQRFWSDADASPTIEVVDATLHAVARSGRTDFESYADLVRPSTVHRMAKESYDRKEWARALAYAERTLLMDSTRADARVIQFKALVRLEEWARAGSVLTDIEQSGDRKQFYLRGFYAWKRRQFDDATRYYQSALDAGDRANAVYRDYAECLYRLSQFEQALDKIRIVRDRDPGNVYILDLVSRICIDGKMFDQAGQALEQLERADAERRFIHHRKSRYYSARQMLDLALVEAESACGTGVAAFEAYAQKADVLIDKQEFEAATFVIDELKQRFGKSRSDVQTGLQCKLLIRRRQWREAQVVWQTLLEKALPVHRAMLRQILLLKAEDTDLTGSERQAARFEAQEIRSDLQVLAWVDEPDVDEADYEE